MLHLLKHRPWFDAALAWYFVTVWGSGFLATKVGLQHAAPFTFLTLRFAFGLACVLPIVLVMQPRWPAGRELGHVVVAGLLMHAVHLGGSHYTQYLGVSAGITALILSAQPLITALIAVRWMGESLAARQWAGVIIGLAGVALIVWHKVDLRSAAAVQFAATIAVLAPLAWAFEDLRVDWSWELAGSILFLVIGASLLAVSALHTLMRRGQATRVTSLLYLTPIFAVALELPMFGVVPSALSLAGIAVTCLGVALVTWRAARPARPERASRS